MKASISNIITSILIVSFLFCIPTPTSAQNRKRTVRTTGRSSVSGPQRPASPTPVSQKARTINDLLYFPYGCLPNTVTTSESAAEQLTELFGTYENVNGGIGLHNSPAYAFTYKGTPIGLCHYDWYGNRQWYEFYFDSKSSAQQFYSVLCNDIRQAGIPMTKDRIYGGLSTRKRPISIFKEVYVFLPSLIKEADKSNIHGPEVVGKYVVEMGVYRRR